MKDLVEFIAKALVDNPEAVHVEQLEDERTITLELRVAADDMGKVIGKQGRIAKAIRTVVNAAAATEKKRVFVEIVQ
ncbi:MAG TPA: KH domain-containing protein [Firmicutes bacterium]|nr:KH domain-containing protein [Bacillota bacterium]HAA38186.1 KH domain-containing protein [Bacillota bacterium]